MGRTEVLCAASVEDGAPDHAKQRGAGWITAEYAMLPRAGDKRTARARGASGGRAQEISRLVGRALRSAVDLTRLGNRTITIDCDVLRADGGTRTAAVNGGWVALVLALRKLYRGGALADWPLRDLVSGVSVGLVKGRFVVDMAYADDAAADADLNLVLTASGRIIEIQGTAERAPFSPADVARAIALARRAAAQISRGQRKAVGRLP